MMNPYELLGIGPEANQEQIRHAYHLAARKYHPDKFQDPQQQKQAQERMTTLNLAYQEAMRIAGLKKDAPYHQQISCEDAVKLSRKLLKQGYPEGALRELLRSETRSPMWFFQQGEVLMAMEQYESARQSYREAVRRDPANNTFRAGALAAEMAQQKSRTLGGRLHRALRDVKRRLAK